MNSQDQYVNMRFTGGPSDGDCLFEYLGPDWSKGDWFILEGSEGFAVHVMGDFVEVDSHTHAENVKRAGPFVPGYTVTQTRYRECHFMGCIKYDEREDRIRLRKLIETIIPKRITE